jgi:hypothetical protein
MSCIPSTSVALAALLILAIPDAHADDTGSVHSQVRYTGDQAKPYLPALTDLLRQDPADSPPPDGMGDKVRQIDPSARQIERLRAHRYDTLSVEIDQTGATPPPVSATALPTGEGSTAVVETCAVDPEDDGYPARIRNTFRYSEGQWNFQGRSYHRVNACQGAAQGDGAT